ncbi:family 1 encapsulin nanocompartment shell protein [Vulcanisaeta distributa]|uniref:Linocin_M18 bacteriocin protein n=1 Tax=Vulcanisaeta distributa (strain DSM 14429 / JCM 11212 / NBRC 100878 / IC-017) TaxID=572478 RepID=E1QQB7_VULDI|nr:family 1 encapsulin nanocompartment shell protein [Vulcanisaeta distributa]ADN51604.1 Linocin_M18 bacteriocin protein [Vulcanisaeta distributa DSM 14429]
MMFSKNPVDIIKDRKFSQGEIADSLRLAIMAELDAINLYLQLSRLIDDERVRRVFEDIAKEEKTHFGEFLTLLKSYDPEQVEQLKAGSAEVGELTGIKLPANDPNNGQRKSGSTSNANDPPPDVVSSSNLSPEELRYIQDRIREVANGVRRFRKYLTVYEAGPGLDAVPLDEVVIGPPITATRSVIPLKELSVKFSILQRQVEYARARGERVYSVTADQAAIKLGYEEDSAILSDILSNPRVRSMSISSWDMPGSAVNEVSSAVNALYGNYIPEPYVLFVSPGRYTKLLMVVERTGVMELTRVKSLVKDVVIIPQLKDDTALLLSAHQSIIDIAVGVDTALVYLGPEDRAHGFVLWETLTVRIKDPRGVIILRQG